MSTFASLVSDAPDAPIRVYSAGPGAGARRPALARIACAGVALLLVLGCGGSGSGYSAPTGPGTGGSGGGGGGGGGGGTVGNAASVLASGLTFSPSSATITAGGTVTWTFAQQHTVHFTSSTKPTGGDIPATSSGSVSRTFPTAGTYTYYCLIHGTAMHGTIIVQ